MQLKNNGNWRFRINFMIPSKFKTSFNNSTEYGGKHIAFENLNNGD